MTIDEIIENEKHVIEENKQFKRISYGLYKSIEYHEQIVKYLEELKAIKDNRVFVSNEPIEEIYLRGYKRGLEDVKAEQSVGNDLNKFREQLKEFHKVDVIVR